MQTRTLFKWIVKLQRMDTAEVYDYKVATYWDPNDIDTPSAVQTAARIQAMVETRVDHQLIAEKPVLTNPPKQLELVESDATS